MFLLYVNDLPDFVTLSSVAAFADDTKLFKHIISNITDNSLLQRDVNNVEAWFSSSDMSFNDRKCKFQSQTISRKRKYFFIFHKAKHYLNIATTKET